MKTVLQKIDKEKNENEFNRTEILKGHLEGMIKKPRKKFDLNSTQGIRLMDRSDCSTKKKSYMNKLIKKNQEQYNKITNHQSLFHQDCNQPLVNKNLIYL